MLQKSHSYPIKASVHLLSGYPGLVDQKDLVEWSTAIQPKSVKLIHGEPTAKNALKKQLAQCHIQAN